MESAERFHVTPQLLRAGIASMTQLPPSPEFKQLASPRTLPEPLTLNQSRSMEDEENEEITPLDAVARFTDFHPEALACSMPLTSGYYSDDSGQRQRNRELPFTSLGAVAGPHGVALFRVSKPHVPLLFLKHESQMSSSTGGGTTSGGGTSLAFQPENGQSLFLASARGTGILVWDVSGNTLNPLAGRVGFDPALAGSNISNTRITSLVWQPNHPHILAATTPTVACLWDLRSSNGSSSIKPSLRFGKTQRVVGNQSMGNGPSFVHLACTDHDTCATMDAKGFVHMFDLRSTGNDHNTVVGAVSSFSAFQHAGVGISSFPTSRDGMGWITWGLDRPDRAVVKVWSSDAATAITNDHDDYWYMDSSMDPSLRTCAHLSKSTVGGYRLAAQCATPGLACARVCPSPIQDHFVTVSASVTAEGDGWKADVWKLGGAENEFNEGGDYFGLEKVVSMRGGSRRDMSLRQLLGISSLGQICGAELALLSSNTQQRRPSSDGSRHEYDDDMKVVLCCLTGNGYVTAQFVPEVVSKKSEAPSSGMESPVRASRLGVRSLFAGNTTRVFNLDKDGYALNDAAGAWNAQGEYSIHIRSSNDDEAAENAPAYPNLHIDAHHDFDSFQTLPRQPEGGVTPFDMDGTMNYAGSTVALSAVGDPASQAGPSAIIDEVVSPNNELRTTSDFMERIDKERIPCPRFCGATFGFGVGGIALFNNGEVKKMWSWYQQSHSRQKAALPFENFELQLPRGGNTGALQTSDPYHFNLGEKAKSKEFPKTLQDIADMLGSAKEAQWGEVVDSSRSGEDEVDDFFDEESFDDGSNSSDSFHDDSSGKKANEANQQDGKNEEGRPSMHRKAPDSPSFPGRKIRGPVASGPSSDMLAPIVRVKVEFDEQLLNNQSPELAIRLELGDWEVPGHETATAIKKALERQNSPVAVNSVQSSRNVVIPGQELPHYRALFPNVNSKPLAKVKSDPMMDKMPQLLGLPFRGDEPGVHGGEYSVRPGRQESMVFLRKLFTHQQEGGMVYPSLISPPDGPMLPSSLSPLKRNRSLVSITFPFEKPGPDDRDHSRENADNPPTGVHTLDSQQPGTQQNLYMRRLTKTRELCVRNGAACETVGQDDKANVWSLLAETVDGLLENSSDDFSGWGGFGGGSLGNGLVQNLLRYYESLGDVQMLSTLVCVLSGGSRISKSVVCEPNPLLPADCNDRYDTYLRKYSEILYAWGMLTKRAEVSKHLARDPNNSIEATCGFAATKTTEGSPGLMIAITCPRCGVETTDGSNICQSCRDFTLRCSICSNAVRGLFTVCESCGHGGHVGHLMEWFARSSDCPTGCGCKCTMQTRSSPTDPLPDHLIDLTTSNSKPSPFDQMVDMSAEGLNRMREMHFARIAI